jgi:hypothetical protein
LAPVANVIKRLRPLVMTFHNKLGQEPTLE